MVLFSLAIAYLSAVLPLFVTGSQDPLIWATVEAQGAYIIGDAASGRKCSAVPNTFEMRADGAWLPASEFDLTGNFDEDCGIHVTLSIPSEQRGPDPVIDGEKLEADRKLLKKEEEELEAEKKTVEEKERALESEKGSHREKMDKSKLDKTALDKKKSEVEDAETKMKKQMDELKGRMDLLAKRKDEIQKRRKALDAKKALLEGDRSKFDLESDAHKREKEEVEKEKNELEEEKDRLKRVYENCEELKTDLHFMIPPSMLEESKLCHEEED